jgi:hypothetical protein
MLAFVGHGRLLTIALKVLFEHKIWANSALHKHNCVYIGIYPATRTFEDLVSAIILRFSASVLVLERLARSRYSASLIPTARLPKRSLQPSKPNIER